MPTELDRSRTLIRSVTDDPRFADAAYLEWLYDQNPIGPNCGSDLDHAGRLVGHVGGVPQLYRKGDRTGVGVLLVNLSVSDAEPARETASGLVRAVVDRARRDGRVLVHGVVAPAVATALGADAKARQVATLPAVVCVPPIARTGHVKTYAVDASFLKSDEFAEIARDLDRTPAREWTQVWSPEVLAWRLSRPGFPYTMHVGREIVAVSVRDGSHRLPCAVILKLFPRGALGIRRSARDVVLAACRHHRAPFALYAGRNDLVQPFGVALRTGWLAAPRSLVALPVNDLDGVDSLDFGTFELLDFDER